MLELKLQHIIYSNDFDEPLIFLLEQSEFVQMS